MAIAPVAQPKLQPLNPAGIPAVQDSGFTALKDKLGSTKTSIFDLSPTEQGIINRAPNIPKAAPTVMTSDKASKKVAEVKNDLAANNSPQIYVNVDGQLIPKDQLDRQNGVVANNNGTATTGNTPNESGGVNNATDKYAADVDAYQRDLEDNFNSVNTLLNSQLSESDQQLNRQIQSIQAEFGKRKAEQERVNKTEKGVVDIAGIRSGRQRYAPEVQAGITSAVESAGIERIAELDRQMSDAITKAQIAAQNGQYDIMIKQAELKGNLAKEKMAAVKDLHNTIMEQKKFDAQEKRYAQEDKRVEREDSRSFINEQFEKFGSQAFKGMSPEMVKDFEAKAGLPMGFLAQQRETLTELEKLEKDGFITVAAGSSIFDPRTGKAVFTAPKEATLPESAKEFEFYNSLTPEQQEAFDAYQNADANRKASSSDPLIEQGRMLSNAIAALTLQGKEKELAEAKASVGQIVSKTTKEAPKSISDGFSKAVSDYRVMINTDVPGIREYALSVDTGPVNGALIKARAKIGTTTAEEEGLLASIADMNSKLLNLRSGAAVTPQEFERLKPLLPSVNKTREQNEKDLEIFERNLRAAVKSQLDLKGLEVYGQDLEDHIRANPNDSEKAEAALSEGYDPEEVLNYLKKKSELGFTPVTDQKQLSKLSNGSTKIAFGEGTVTGIDGSSLWKQGLDFVLKGGKGAPVEIPFSGEVIAAGPNGGFGNQVKIRLDNGEEIWVSHLDSIDVKKGDKVSRKQIIGKQGNTGNVISGGKVLSDKDKGSRGTHLDITMKKANGEYYTAREVAGLLGDKRLQLKA